MAWKRAEACGMSPNLLNHAWQGDKRPIYLKWHETLKKFSLVVV